MDTVDYDSRTRVVCQKLVDRTVVLRSDDNKGHDNKMTCKIPHNCLHILHQTGAQRSS